jgi:hypothetical protein
MRTVSLVLAVILSVICIGWAESAYADPSPPDLTPDSSARLQVDPLLGGDLYTRPIPVANCGDASPQCFQQPEGTPCGVPALGCVCYVIIINPQHTIYRCGIQ